MAKSLYQEIQKHLIEEEGMKLKPYKCTAGKLTIGVGRNLEDKGISESEALYLLDQDITQCISALEKIFPSFYLFSRGRKVALVSMIFQLGEAGFKKFKATIEAVNRLDFKGAASHARNSLWAKQTPNRALRVISLLENGI
jgi:lysozyme